VAFGSDHFVFAVSPGRNLSSAAFSPSPNRRKFSTLSSEIYVSASRHVVDKGRIFIFYPLTHGLFSFLLPASTAHSHSIVAGGLPEISYATREIPLTSLMIRRDTSSKNSNGRWANLAVIKSTVSTARSETTYS